MLLPCFYKHTLKALVYQRTGTCIFFIYPYVHLQWKANTNVIISILISYLAYIFVLSFGVVFVWKYLLNYIADTELLEILKWSSSNKSSQCSANLSASLSSNIQYYLPNFLIPAVERSFHAAFMEVLYNLICLARGLKDDKKKRGFEKERRRNDVCSLGSLNVQPRFLYI